MTSIYYDHRALLGADEKPILNRRHRRYVGSTPLEKTFGQEVQMSAAPSKRKGRFAKESVGIDKTVGNPTEIYNNKEPTDSQYTKFEDDNVRFLATGQRKRHDPANRRYQKFQTATQRISSLNVFYDGTPRQGAGAEATLEKMLELMQKPQTQSTLNMSALDNGAPPLLRPNPVFNPGTPSLPGSLGNVSLGGTPGVLTPRSSRGSISSAAGAGVPPIDLAAVAAAIAASKKSAFEDQLNLILKDNRKNIKDEIVRAQQETAQMIKDIEDQKGGVPPELEKISEKIKKFDEAKFEKNHRGDKIEPGKLSKTNKDALNALAAFLASKKVNEYISPPGTPGTPSPIGTPNLTDKMLNSLKITPGTPAAAINTPLPKSPSPTASNVQSAIEELKKIRDTTMGKKLVDAPTFDTRIRELAKTVLLEPNSGSSMTEAEIDTVPLKVLSMVLEARLMTPKSSSKASIPTASNIESKDDSPKVSQSDVDILIEMLMNNKIPKAKDKKIISKLIGKTEEEIDDILAIPNGNVDLAKDLEFAKNALSPTANTELTTSSLRRLAEFHFPDKQYTDYRKTEAKEDLRKFEYLIFDHDFLDTRNLPKKDRKEVFDKFDRTFSKPSSGSSKNSYDRVKYIEMYIDTKKKIPSKKDLEKVSKWEENQLKSGFNSLSAQAASRMSFT